MAMRFLLFVGALLFSACHQSPQNPAAAPIGAPSAQIKQPVMVTGPQAQQLVAEGALLLDVRTPDEFGQLHIDGARNVPLDTLANQLASLPKGKPVVVYCAAGRRSAKAAELLASAGYDVRNLGAMENWKTP
jgi:rhodanese-related sulfurtransferase